MKKIFIIAIALLCSLPTLFAREGSSHPEKRKPREVLRVVSWEHADVPPALNKKILALCKKVTFAAQSQVVITNGSGKARMSKMYRSHLLGSDVLFTMDVLYTEQKEFYTDKKPTKKYSILFYGDCASFFLCYDANKNTYSVKFKNPDYAQKCAPTKQDLQQELASAIDRISTLKITLINYK